MRNYLILFASFFVLFILIIVTAVTNPVQVNTRVKDDVVLIEEIIEEETCDSEFCSHLPIVTINTFGEEIDKFDVTWSTIEFFDDADKFNSINDKPDDSVLSTIKIRGQSSSEFKKKQYRIEFYKDNQLANYETRVLGMKAENDWILNGPYLDRSLVRNHLMYETARDLMEWAPNSKYCEVLLNGEYQGIYLLMETIKVSDNRIDLKDFALLDGDTPFLIQREFPGQEKNPIETLGDFTGRTAYELSIKYPVSSRLLTSHEEYIEDTMNRFERVLYSDLIDDPNEGYHKYIDIDNFVDYYILNEFSMNIDGGNRSTYIYMDLDGLLKMVVWDFNNAFDLYYEARDPESFINNEENWFGQLLTDRTFTERVISRYHELRQASLSNEALYYKIDQYVNKLGEAIKRNDEVWSYEEHFFNLTTLDGEGNRFKFTHEEAVEMLKEFIRIRGAYLDENIEQLLQHVKN
jgi:hypothetical protein